MSKGINITNPLDAPLIIKNFPMVPKAHWWGGGGGGRGGGRPN